MKSLLLYLGLVGVPAAALLGILHAGSRLQAPPAIGGEWTAGDGTRIDVTQSGVYVSVAVAGARLNGRLRGDSLVATADDARGGADEGCTPGEARALRAVVRGGRLRGVLEFPGRPGCPPLAVDAARQAAERKRGRGH